MTAHHPIEISSHDRAGLNDWLESCSYGPFGYFQAAIIGFVLGTVAFLGADAALNETPGQLNEVPIYLACAFGSSVLLVGLAFVGNYLIGRQIRYEVALERAIFAAGTLPPPMPRPDLPGYDLRPDPEAGRARVPLPSKREVETV